MERVIVIGCPGSGKSTLARSLSEKTGLPLYYLDMMYWNADKTTVEREDFLACLNEAMAKDRWVIDGNYLSTMELRMEKCDAVLFLDYSCDVCLGGVEARMGKPRADMPWIETEWDGEFRRFIEKFIAESRPKILALLEKHKEKEIHVFRTRAEASAWLMSL